jgi:soluble P-type ATPase
MITTGKVIEYPDSDLSDVIKESQKVWKEELILEIDKRYKKLLVTQTHNDISGKTNDYD